MQQKRLLLALVISSAILFLWTFFYPVPQTQKPGATPSPTASPAATQQTENSNNVPATPAPQPIANVSTAPQRMITVRTPLYDAKFDTLGAEPVSWIIKVNKYSSKGQSEV